MTGEVLFRAQGVGVCFRTGSKLLRPARHWGVRSATLELRRGETLGIIGDNGAGKTSLMRIIAGIYEPDRGSVERISYRASLLALQIGFVPHLTGWQNACLGCMLLGLSRAESRDRLEAIAEFAELGEYMSRPVQTYSSGMGARLGLAVALQADPEVLLIDEILGVGDIGFREKSANAIRERIRSDRTVVLASHQLGSIEELCNRVLWMDAGKSRELGPPKEVLRAYREYKLATAPAPFPALPAGVARN